MDLPEGCRPDTKQIARRVIELLEEELAGDGFELLDVRVFQGGGRFQVRIYVDRRTADGGEAGGISLDEVARASRTAGMLLEEADLFVGQYVIEVSSPGIRRPLRRPEHFRRACGEKIDLKMTGAGRLRGVLQDLDGQDLVVLPPGGEQEPVRVPLDRVAEANLDPDFDAQAIINADRRRRKETRRLLRESRPRRKKSRPKNRPRKDGGST